MSLSKLRNQTRVKPDIVLYECGGFQYYSSAGERFIPDSDDDENNKNFESGVSKLTKFFSIKKRKRVVKRKNSKGIKSRKTIVIIPPQDNLKYLKNKVLTDIAFIFKVTSFNIKSDGRLVKKYSDPVEKVFMNCIESKFRFDWGFCLTNLLRDSLYDSHLKHFINFEVSDLHTNIESFAKYSRITFKYYKEFGLTIAGFTKLDDGELIIESTFCFRYLTREAVKREYEVARVVQLASKYDVSISDITDDMMNGQ